jgi:hypothetical protein
MPHHLRGNGEKVRAIAPASVYPREEAQKCLLNQRGRLHRMVLTLMAEVTTRQPMQFRIN